jgi:hypothetical protein
MTENERRPERNAGDYDPAEDPDTEAPASAERAGEAAQDDIPEGQAEPSRSEPPPGAPPTAPLDPPSAG